MLGMKRLVQAAPPPQGRRMSPKTFIPRVIGVVAATIFAAACAQNEAPLAPLSTTADLRPEFIDVCHRLDEGYDKLSLPEAAWPPHQAHGDEIAGGRKLDSNCEKYRPMIVRDDFDGPLGPNWYLYRASGQVDAGTLRISVAPGYFFGYFNFRSYFYAPYPVSKIAWELGWDASKTSGQFSRSSSGCSILCNNDVAELFSGSAFMVQYGWNHLTPWAFASKSLTPGEHAVRVEWDRILGRATYWVDGELLISIPTVPRFTLDYGVIDFGFVGTTTLTYLQYEIYPE